MDGLFLTSCRHWWERVNNTVIESHHAHLSVTSGSSRLRTRTARLIDRDANDCAISLSPLKKVNFITYPLQRSHRIHWYVKVEAFSTCVNGRVQRRQVIGGVGLKRHVFGRECRVLLLKVFDRNQYCASNCEPSIVHGPK